MIFKCPFLGQNDFIPQNFLPFSGVRCAFARKIELFMKLQTITNETLQ